MPLTQDELVRLLEAEAPLALAESWDNVGVLVDSERAAIETVLLCIDLTEPVVTEAQELGADFVIAYHPVIFGGLKRLVRSEPAGRIARALVREGIGVYSPHTALDAVPGGVNDWLIEAFEVSRTQPLVDHASHGEAGMGRLAELAQPLELGVCVERIKAHLGMSHVRLSTPPTPRAPAIRSVAVCAGAGGGVFAESPRTKEADLWWTGEMRHHDVLSAAARGHAVVLCEHSNTERGFLPAWAPRLEAAARGAIRVVVSDVDRDPLLIA